MKTPEIDFNKLDEKTRNALQEFNKHFFKESEQLYLSVDKLRWQSSRLYQRLGFCQYDLKQYSKAFDSFSKAIQCNPHNKELYAWRRMAARGTLFYSGCMKDLCFYAICRFNYGMTFQDQMQRHL